MLLDVCVRVWVYVCVRVYSGIMLNMDCLPQCTQGGLAVDPMRLLQVLQAQLHRDGALRGGEAVDNIPRGDLVSLPSYFNVLAFSLF